MSIELDNNWDCSKATSYPIAVKLRFDLLPLDTLIHSHLLKADQAAGLIQLYRYMLSTNTRYLYDALDAFLVMRNWSSVEMILAVTRYTTRIATSGPVQRWEAKDITYVPQFISQALEHYFGYIESSTSGDHDAAFVWNILWAIHTIEHRDHTEFKTPTAAHLTGPGHQQPIKSS